VCENVLSPRWGYEFTPLCTPDLRPGLHSGAAPRLKNDGIVPPRFRFLRSHTDSAVLGFTMTPLKGAGVRRSGTGSIQNFTGLHLVSEDGRAGLYYDAPKRGWSEAIWHRVYCPELHWAALGSPGFAGWGLRCHRYAADAVLAPPPPQQPEFCNWVPLRGLRSDAASRLLCLLPRFAVELRDATEGRRSQAGF